MRARRAFRATAAVQRARPTAVVPARARGLADALIHDTDLTEAAAAFGASYARAGEGLDVCLGDLDDTYLAVRGDDPPTSVVRQVALAWSDIMQQRYNCLTCADPLTGLTSIQHLQSQVAALYRAAGDGWLVDADIARTHQLVIVELPVVREDVDSGFALLEASLRKAGAADLVTEMVPQCSQVAELSHRRLGGVARRTPDLHGRLARVVAVLDARMTLSPSQGGCRAWSENLPVGPDAARALLDELAR